MGAIAAVQDSAFATWIRESDWAMFAFLIVHTLSMGFLVGAGMAINARLLGVARRIPASALGQLRPVMLTALPIAVASGALLLIGYPAKALTNPLFYVKLALVVAALAVTFALLRRVRRQSAGLGGLAALGLALWVFAVPAGKFLAYTHHVLLLP